jgi:uncharacterized SAM-binding protein YcdF (DUF218 family)
MNGWAEFRQALGDQPLVAGDVIFLMVGDGLFRVPYAAKLWRDGFAPRIAIVGRDGRREYGSYPAEEMVAELERLGVPAAALVVHANAPHTRGEAESFLRLARQFGWHTGLIVTSPHHQYRAFLTFVKAMLDLGIRLTLVNAPAPLSWTETTPWGTRADLQEGELRRIADYGATGHVAGFEEGVRYLDQLRSRQALGSS